MWKALFTLVLVMLLTGCGMGSSNQEQNGNTTGSGGEMVPTLTENGTLKYIYQVTNQTDEMITLEFTSSQRFDYAVETKNGEEVFLFSSVASFLKALGEEKVQPGEALEYKIDLQDLQLAAGDYVLTAWMTPEEGEKYSVSKHFTVE